MIPGVVFVSVKVTCGGYALGFHYVGRTPWTINPTPMEARSRSTSEIHCETLVAALGVADSHLCNSSCGSF